MRKALMKKIAAAVVFVLSVFVIDRIMNQKNVDITMEMPAASLPAVSVLLKGHKVNTMHGYTKEQEESYTRGTITPVGADRSLTLAVDTFQQKIAGINYEVRSADGERLIEGNEITDYQEKEDVITFDLQLKDLIEANQEYSFITILTMEEGSRVYYYTRMIQQEEAYEEEKLDYVMWFHDTVYAGGDGQELKQYMESNSQGDNTTFHRVDIHSSLSQLMWDGLSMKKVDEPIIRIRDISAQTMSVTLEYTTVSGTGKNADYYFTEEYYRIRYTADRVYLLDYERTTEEIFKAESASFTENQIGLGIADTDLKLEETEGGTILAFVNAHRLFVYNTVENKLIQVFSFYDKSNFDMRTVNRGFDIRILNMEDSGNLSFMVSGYMNRGNHEGQVGIAVYYYDSVANMVEEQMFIPYGKSEEILMREVETLSFLNRDSHMFFLLEGGLYEVNPADKSCELLVSGLTEDSYEVSETQRMLAWSLDGESLLWMNMSSGEKVELTAGEGELITVLGFMEEDLIYGLVREEDVQTDITGNTIYPAYKVMIASQAGEVLKTYEKEGILITDCRVEENQITLERAEKLEDGSYRSLEDDQIASNDTGQAMVNQVSSVTIDVYETIVSIVLKSSVDTQTLKVMTPREVIFEGQREVALTPAEEIESYYVYGPYGVDRICGTAAEAVTRAYELSGSVTDEAGREIWKKGTFYTKNQIMAIEGEKGSAQKSSLAVCLDAILELEGVSRLTQPMLERGEDAYGILENSLNQADILDLTGCSLDAVLYYPDQDIPVLAFLEDGEAALIIGFNEFNVVLMDPSTGTVYKKGMNDSRTLFSENGNRFLTYIRQ